MDSESRVPSPESRLDSLCCDCRLDVAVATLAFLIGEYRFEQMTTAEVGPERLNYIDLGVGNLPQQVVADAKLSARADQQIGVRLAGRVEEAREALLVQILRPDPRFDRPARGIDD